MTRSVIIALDGLSESEHARIANVMKLAGSRLHVAEDDHRLPLAIDRQAVQIALASISATCAALALVLNSAPTGPVAIAKHEKHSDLVNQVLDSCGARLPPEIADQIRSCSFQMGTTETLRIDAPDGTYELTIHNDEALTYVRGTQVTVRRTVD